MKKVLKFMQEIVPDLSPEVDENTSLADIWFDQFCCELLARKLNDEYTILIPDREVDAWETVGDIFTTVKKYEH